MVLNITSLGFNVIGFSPWASRTWPEIKGENTCKGSSAIKRQIFSYWTLQPFTLRGKRTFPVALSKLLFYCHGKVVMTILKTQSYIFGISPSTLGRPHFTLSHQPQGQVREGCQISTSTHCSLLWNKGEAGSCRGQSELEMINRVSVSFSSKNPLKDHFSHFLN